MLVSMLVWVISQQTNLRPSKAATLLMIHSKSSTAAVLQETISNSADGGQELNTEGSVIV